MDLMNTNISELRKEAYRLWGVDPTRVIYDMPRHASFGSRFMFKACYDEEVFNSWPRAYVLTLPNLDTVSRVLMPVYNVKNDSHVKLVVPAWYDMPAELHQKMVKRVEEGKPVFKRLKWWQRLANKLGSKYEEVLPVEDYVFEVFRNDRAELSITVLPA